MVRVDLLPHTPQYREDMFRDLFKTTPGAPPSKTEPDNKTPTARPAASEGEAKAAEDTKADAKPAAKPRIAPVRIVFDGIRERATFIPLGVSAETPVISPDGKFLVYRARFGDQQQLFSYPLDELAREPAPEQLTGGRRPKRDFAFSPTQRSWTAAG